MTSALKGFHYGHSQKNILRQLIGHTVVIGVVAPLLAQLLLAEHYLRHQQMQLIFKTGNQKPKLPVVAYCQ